MYIFCGVSSFQEQNAVLLYMDDVGVIVCNAQLHVGITGTQRQDDIKNDISFGGTDGDFVFVQISADGLLFGIRYRCNDFQNLIGVPCNDTRCCSCFNTLQTIGVRHDNTLDIFDDVAAGFNQNGLG